MAYGIHRLFRPSLQRLAPVLGIALTVAAGLAFFSVRQTRIWQNSDVLWLHAVKHGGQRSVPARSHLGHMYLNQLDFERSAAEFETALETDPNDPKPLSGLGLVLLAQRKPAEAEARFKTALRSDPNHPLAHGGLAHLARISGRPEDEETHLRAALAQAPQRFITRIRLAELLFELRRFDEAAQNLAIAAQLRPEDPRVIALGSRLQESNEGAHRPR
jgi:Tfp pilus assembly protein PilF